jgi:phospholipase/lecithinase/hemolysin
MIRYRPGIVRVLVALTLFLTVNGFVSAGPTYSQIISFGDSLTDVGNDYFLSGNTQPPSSLGYDNGRASNGPLWVEDLATKLGIAAPTPSLLGGTDYAYGGATASPLNTGVPNLGQQVQSYLNTAHTADPKALYTVLAGANDFFGNDTNAASVAGYVSSAVSTLLAAGAKTVLVPNLPAQGLTPYGRSLGPTGSAALSNLDAAFNVDLAADLASLRAANPTASIISLDLSGLLTQLLADPGAFGITNTTDEAILAVNGGQNINPNQYLFWDDVHPTAAGHMFIADAAFRVVVPEPTGLTLAGIAIGGVAVRVARRRAVVR